eukprot:Pgem_evm1s1342
MPLVLGPDNLLYMQESESEDDVEESGERPNMDNIDEGEDRDEGVGQEENYCFYPYHSDIRISYYMKRTVRQIVISLLLSCIVMTIYGLVYVILIATDHYRDGDETQVGYLYASIFYMVYGLFIVLQIMIDYYFVGFPYYQIKLVPPNNPNQDCKCAKAEECTCDNKINGNSGVIVSMVSDQQDISNNNNNKQLSKSVPLHAMVTNVAKTTKHHHSDGDIGNINNDTNTSNSLPTTTTTTEEQKEHQGEVSSPSSGFNLNQTPALTEQLVPTQTEKLVPKKVAIFFGTTISAFLAVVFLLVTIGFSIAWVIDDIQSKPTEIAGYLI